MEKQKKLNTVEQSAVDLTRYGKLQLDKLKLQLVDNLSTVFNSIFGTLIILILSSFALLFLAVAFTLVLGVWIGSYPGAMLIVAGIFILAAVIVFVCRKKLIVNGLVRMFAKIIFENDDDADRETHANIR